MALSYLDDSSYSLGMMRDTPSWLIPNGGVYDSLNYVYDQPGIARQRMGSSALSALGAQTAFATSLGFCYSQDATTIETLYGMSGKTGLIASINKATGASSGAIAGAGVNIGIIGRPVRHFGFVVFPSASNVDATYTCAVLAGETVNTAFTSAAASNIVAGNPQITLTGADVTTNIVVGAIVYGFTANNYYIGRVVSIDTTKLFTVWPTPTTTFSPGGTNLVTGPSQVNITTLMNSGGACAASFQNRLLFGGVNTQGTTPAVTPITRYDRRVSYSLLPTEQGGFNGAFGTKPIDGATFIWRDQYPALNYFDVSGADPIVAMEPVNDNQLLILTSTHPVVFSGDLTTQLATTNPTVTFDLSDINKPAGCLSDLSVQRTKRGIAWAGAGGVFAWDGREPVSLTGDDKTKRIASYWQTLASDAATFVIHGSAYVRDHYIVSGTSGGVTFSLACNMANLQWTRLSGVGTDNFFSVARPSIPQQIFASRWWDQTGAAPSMTNGQTIRLESMFAKYVAGATTTDADGTAVTTNLQTRTITGDAELQKVFHRVTARTQVSSTSASATLTAQSTIDAADTDASRTRALGSLSNTATVTLTNATNATPIVCTSSANHGLQTDDFVDIDAVLGNLNANGRYRINVSNATTFSLVGSSGSAAYTSGGKVKKITEQDYLAINLNEGQGVSLTVAATVNNIEIHGFRVACEQREPVMSA